MLAFKDFWAHKAVGGFRRKNP